jgi:prepilin-type N-terminal cleavage/methylation domain-containing protein
MARVIAMIVIVKSVDSGFTLIEVLVSAALLIVAATGMAQLTTIAANSVEGARGRTTTTMLASQKMEQLRSLVWTYDPGGARRSDVSTDASRDPFTSDGRGLAPSPAGTLDRNLDGYVDYVDARGRWIGAGSTPPPETAYVRRWAILALEADPDHTRVLIVFAKTMKNEGAVVIALKTRMMGSP